jgi:hypothetical protein
LNGGFCGILRNVLHNFFRPILRSLKRTLRGLLRCRLQCLYSSLYSATDEFSKSFVGLLLLIPVVVSLVIAVSVVLITTLTIVVTVLIVATLVVLGVGLLHLFHIRLSIALCNGLLLSLQVNVLLLRPFLELDHVIVHHLEHSIEHA